jgi:leucyl/phenylalanyl-tRNA---protein transferase
MNELYLITDNNIDFPDASNADEYGLVAVSTQLSVAHIMDAYPKGLFPWYKNNDLFWWYAPDPRCILLPKNLKISKSMKPVLNNKNWQFKVNTCFDKVINNCSSIVRKPVYLNGMLYDNDGTWIEEEFVQAYTKLNKEGIAICAETWCNDELIGGLYGVLIGKVFFGESMFSKISNASKYAFINLIQMLEKQNDLQLVDCQQATNHLLSLGATTISTEQFTNYLKQFIVLNN